MNSVELIGRLVADPKIIIARDTQKKIAKFSLAVKRVEKNGDDVEASRRDRGALNTVLVGFEAITTLVSSVDYFFIVGNNRWNHFQSLLFIRSVCRCDDLLET